MFAKRQSKSFRNRRGRDLAASIGTWRAANFSDVYTFPWKDLQSSEKIREITYVVIFRYRKDKRQMLL